MKPSPAKVVAFAKLRSRMSIGLNGQDGEKWSINTSSSTLFFLEMSLAVRIRIL